MRLPALDHGHAWYVRPLLALIHRLSGRPAPDIVKTLYYRPELFGHEYSHLTHEIMRGPSYWSVGERELFATFTSSRNQCVF